jgi:hypothetical protein
METNKKLYKLLFKNEEKRTLIIKEFEEYLNLNIKGIESDWKLNGEIDINNQKYNEYSENVLQEIQKLNDELKNISENESDEFKKDIKILLSLESENYNIILNIFINKVKCFDLIKDDEDKTKIEKREKEILSLREDLSSIREQINDFITNLKYKYLY